MKVTVYHNEARGHFSADAEEVRRFAELHKVAEFEVDKTAFADDVAVLNHVYEQLNVGGDIVPATPWTEEYRANRNRSLSVGDVVSLEGASFPYVVARFGFETTLNAALAFGIRRGQRASA